MVVERISLSSMPHGAWEDSDRVEERIGVGWKGAVWIGSGGREVHEED